MTPDAIDDLDPDHILSLIDHLERDMHGARSTREPRSDGPPAMARTLRPGEPGYRPPKPRSKAAQAAFERDTTPTEADFAAARSGKPVRARDARHAMRLMRAREILKAEAEGN